MWHCRRVRSERCFNLEWVVFGMTMDDVWMITNSTAVKNQGCTGHLPPKPALLPPQTRIQKMAGRPARQEPSGIGHQKSAKPSRSVAQRHFQRLRLKQPHQATLNVKSVQRLVRSDQRMNHRRDVYGVIRANPYTIRANIVAMWERTIRLVRQAVYQTQHLVRRSLMTRGQRVQRKGQRSGGSLENVHRNPNRTCQLLCPI